MKAHAPPTPNQARQVVITGGPGAGKTALVEVVRRTLCSHVYVIPEAASLVFAGGFPRAGDDAAKRAAQLAIFAVQRELEHFAASRPDIGLILCDRGTLDGAAYWPGDQASFWKATGTTREAELARYAAVIHLHTPPANNGYDHSNRWRVETAEEALAIDRRIAEAWAGHPRRFEIPVTTDFTDKVSRGLALLRELLPPGCRPQ